MTDERRSECLRILRIARQRVNSSWTRGAYRRLGRNGKMRYCLVGAVVSPKSSPVANTALAALRETLIRDGKGPQLTAWNDEQSSKYPVLWLIDVTISRLEEAFVRE